VGRHRKVLPVGELPIVGGALCLDLVNTTGARLSSSPRERLKTDADLRVWASRVGLGDAGHTPLARTLELRELLYAILRPLADGTTPPSDAISTLSDWWRAERSRRGLVLHDGVFELSLQPSADDDDAMLWPIVASAVELLTSERLARLKRCGECDWLFLDESKNGSRTWCKKDCGDRARARRHYARARPLRSRQM
jgi:predicted RNA-binding Zn ribbon-like protein